MLNERVLRPVEDCANAAATIVSAYDNVFDLERLDRKLQNGHAIEVRRINDIRNISVHEDFAWLQGGDDVRRHATIGTADPQVLGTPAKQTIGGNNRGLQRCVPETI
jgi:hypothetical protein